MTLAARLGTHLRSNVVSYLALAVATSGTAYAVPTVLAKNSVRSAQIVNGQVKPVDLSKSTVQKLSTPGPAGADGKPGLVRGYGRVASNGTLSSSSPGVSVTRPETGLYCIVVTGVDPTSTVVVATPDFNNDATGTGANNSQSFVEYGGGGGLCPTTALSVRTFVRTYATSSGDLISTNLQLENQPFTFLVP